MINIKTMTKSDLKELCSQLGVKYCSKCDKYLNISEFYQRKSSWGGASNRCIACCRSDNKEWRDKNAEYLLVKKRAYREVIADKKACASGNQ